LGRVRKVGHLVPKKSFHHPHQKGKNWKAVLIPPGEIRHRTDGFRGIKEERGGEKPMQSERIRILSRLDSEKNTFRHSTKVRIQQKKGELTVHTKKIQKKRSGPSEHSAERRGKRNPKNQKELCGGGTLSVKRKKVPSCWLLKRRKKTCTTR